MDIFSNINGSMALTMLMYIFGPVLSAFVEADFPDPSKITQAQGLLFNVFNSAVLFLGAVYVIIHAASAVLRTAHEGEVMGKSWSSMWVPLRLSLGFAILLPLSTGYSMIQSGVLWFTVQGSNLADTAVRVIAPTFTNIDIDHLIKLEAGSVAETAMGAWNSSLCVESANRASTSFNALTKYQDRPSDMSVQYVVGASGERAYLYGSAYANQRHAKMNVVTTVAMHSPSDTTCGEIVVGKQSFEGQSPINDTLRDLGGIKLDDTQIQKEIKLFADRYTAHQVGRMDDLISGIHKLAIEFVNAPNHGARLDQIAQKRLNVIKKLNNLIVQFDRESQLWLNEERQKVKFSSVLAKELLAAIQRDGWLSFGSFYIQIARLNMSLQGVSKISMGNLNYTAPRTEELVTDVRKEREMTMQSVSNTISELASQVARGGVKFYNTFGAVNTYNTIVDFGNKIDKKVSDGDFDPSRIKRELDERIVEETLKLNELMALTSESSSDPIPALIQDGVSMMNTGVRIMIAGSVVAALATSTPGDVVGADGAWEFMSPKVMAIIISLIVIGAFLAIVVPAQPLMIWVMAIVGWLTALMEAVVIAPIWALSWLSPEGEGFAGQRAEQGMLLILSVFLRPILIVAGMLSAIIISIPVFGFVRAVTDNLAVIPSPDMDPVILIIWVLASIVIKVVLVVTVMMSIFQLIHVIPDKVLRWIGGGQESLGDMGGTQMAEGMVRNQGGQALSSAAGGMLGAATGVKSAMNNIAEKKKRK